ncbi:MAG TPA: UbiA family prenyltransferase [Verrucomicrobiae bacterium]
MPPKLRTLLVLGRVSNLPTVWSNCLAGWWLGGGGNYWKLPLLFLGASLLYAGGMYLNDAFDEQFDRLRRPERPIPSGKISPALVWQLGLGQLALGVLLLLVCGWLAGFAAAALALCILLYDWTHKLFTASPWLMGGCRFWVYLIAGATGKSGLNGFVIFGAAALAFYVVGLSYIARRERSRRPVPVWPVSQPKDYLFLGPNSSLGSSVLLAAPVVLALMLNAGAYRLRAIWISLILGAWLVRCIRSVFVHIQANVGLVVSNLLAGIVLVDWLAVAPQLPIWLGAAVFVPLLGLTKWLQKFVPAT